MSDRSRDGSEAGEPGDEDARERILARVRDALRDRESPEHPGQRAAPGVPTDPPVERFLKRVRKNGGEGVRIASSEAAESWLREFERDFGSAAASPRLSAPLRPDVPEASPRDAELGVSVAWSGVAETGSVLLDGREGRRLQILPPTLLVWVREADVVGTLDEALDGVRDELPAPLALHSGPSKSADLGGVLVRGVHGPGRLVVAVVGGPAGRTAEAT